MTAAVDAFERMDTMYRYQRYFYDATRRYYLLGRDRLLDSIVPGEGETVAEIGCGTGRNLKILAQRFPDTRFFGIDASAEMLRTAAKKLTRAEIDNVRLVTGLAEDLDHRRM